MSAAWRDVTVLLRTNARSIAYASMVVRSEFKKRQKALEKEKEKAEKAVSAPRLSCTHAAISVHLCTIS